MIPVDQLFLNGPLGDEPGDCLRACVASIIECSVEELPNFASFHGPFGWWEQLRRSLRKFGLDAMALNSLDDIEDWGRARYVMATVPSPRGNWNHCVVVDRNGEIAHDPFAPARMSGHADALHYTAICPPYEPFPIDFGMEDT